MIDIISKQDRRQLTILETLAKNECSTLKELARITNASRKTIQDDFSFINEFISPMTIVTSQEGCSLIKPDYISIDYIYACMLNNNLEFSLIELVFFETYDRLEDYADALFISTSTLKRMIRRINTRTKKSHFEITTGPIQLIGHEELIRNMLVNLFLEKYIEFNYPFKQVELDNVNKLVNQVAQNHTASLNLFELEKLKVIILISIVRIQRGHPTRPDSQKRVTKVQSDFLDDLSFKKSFKGIFKIELNETNLVDLLFPFLNQDFVFSYPELLIIKTATPEKEYIYNGIQTLLDYLAETFEVPLSQREALELKLFNTMMLLVRENYLLYNRNKIFLDNLLEDSPLASDIIYKSIKKIFQNQAPFEDYEVEQFLYILITHWSELAEKIQAHDPIYNVGVYMTTECQHSDFIIGTLNTHFKEKFIFQAIVSENYHEAQKHFTEFAFILTNFSNLNSDETPFFAIESYPSPKDFQKIAAIYTQLSKNRG